MDLHWVLGCKGALEVLYVEDAEYGKEAGIDVHVSGRREHIRLLLPRGGDGCVEMYGYMARRTRAGQCSSHACDMGVLFSNCFQ